MCIHIYIYITYGQSSSTKQAYPPGSKRRVINGTRTRSNRKVSRPIVITRKPVCARNNLPRARWFLMAFVDGQEIIENKQLYTSLSVEHNYGYVVRYFLCHLIHMRRTNVSRQRQLFVNARGVYRIERLFTKCTKCTLPNPNKSE